MSAAIPTTFRWNGLHSKSHGEQFAPGVIREGFATALRNFPQPATSTCTERAPAKPVGFWLPGLLQQCECARRRGSI